MKCPKCGSDSVIHHSRSFMNYPEAYGSNCLTCGSWFAEWQQAEINVLKAENKQLKEGFNADMETVEEACCTKLKKYLFEENDRLREGLRKRQYKNPDHFNIYADGKQEYILETDRQVCIACGCDKGEPCDSDCWLAALIGGEG